MTEFLSNEPALPSGLEQRRRIRHNDVRGYMGNIAAWGEWQNGRQLTPTQLIFAGHWAAATGLDPGSLADLRAVINKRQPTGAIRRAIDAHLGGDIGLLRQICTPGQTVWPQNLLDGAEAWPRPPKPSVTADLPSITPFAEALPTTLLPPTWGDVRRWYHETYPLQYRVGQAAPVEMEPLTNAPLDDWGAYWTAELHAPIGRIINESLINLIGVPHIDDCDELEHALTQAATRVPYLCLAGERNIRNGSEEPGTTTYVTKTETTLFNLLALYLLRGGRPVSFEKLCIRSGLTTIKARRDFGQLMNKVNRPEWPQVIIPTGRDHYTIHDETILVDYRPDPAESAA